MVVQTAMQWLRADEIQVSGQGLREGIALAALGSDPPSAAAVRQASIGALTRRFATWKPDAARRRARIGLRLLDILRPNAPEEMRETVANVCTLLDIGRSVDYFDRHRNAAMIVAAADLYGFSQRAIALLFAVLMQAGNAANRLKTLQPLLRAKDETLVLRAAALLSLAMLWPGACAWCTTPP